MTKKTLYVLWGVLFILCAGLGFIPGFSAEVQTGVQMILTLLSVGFFVPPAWLLYRAGKERDAHTLKLVRNLSALSLGLTLLALVLNFLSVLSSQVLGNILYSILIMVSTPMVCSGYWVLSLFLWACLLMVSLSALKKHRG